MNTYHVYMTAHMSREVSREVEIEFESGKSYSIEDTLELIFMNGQNEVQPVPGICSVSVGDVIELCPMLDYYKVEMEGFTRMTFREFNRYCREAAKLRESCNWV